jgi:hypothetical protein
MTTDTTASDLLDAERRAAIDAANLAVDAAIETRLRALSAVEEWRYKAGQPSPRWPDAELHLIAAEQDAEASFTALVRARQDLRLATYERDGQKGAAPARDGDAEDDDLITPLELG